MERSYRQRFYNRKYLFIYHNHCLLNTTENNQILPPHDLWLSDYAEGHGYWLEFNKNCSSKLECLWHRGGLAIWAIGHCPVAHHFRAPPPPSPKQGCEGPQQLSLPGGPEWSQSAPALTQWQKKLLDTVITRYNGPLTHPIKYLCKLDKNKIKKIQILHERKGNFRINL